jgi:hypothetical protein
MLGAANKVTFNQVLFTINYITMRGGELRFKIASVIHIICES